MLKKTMDIIITQVQNILIDKGFTRYDLNANKNDNILATFVNESNFYSITTNPEKKTVNLLMGSKEGNKLLSDEQVISSWLFDPDTDGEEKAESIGRDFVELLTGPSPKKSIKFKNKGEEENTSSPLFFMNRLATLFPNLKELIQFEKKDVESFRYVSFVKTNVVSQVQGLLSTSNEKSEVKKLGKILSDNYDNGDLDVRGLITIVILNSIEAENQKMLLKKYLSDDLKNAWEAAEKLKGKKIKPEKVKKRKSFTARLLESSEQNK